MGRLRERSGGTGPQRVAKNESGELGQLDTRAQQAQLSEVLQSLLANQNLRACFPGSLT